MRKILLSVALSMITLSSLAALAQSEQEPTGPEGAVSLSPQVGPESEAPAASHTVEKGDTLWDLSQKYLGSPWYWPKVWSNNPEIANPNWIYPGSTVRFFASGEDRPTQVEVGNGPSDLDEVAIGLDEEDRVTVAGPLGYVPKKGVSLQATGFVTAAEVEETGVIVGSFSETEMLSFPQQFYAEFPNQKAARMGETFVIFRSGGALTHPITRAPFGFLTTIVGAGRVVRLDKNGMATLNIDKQFDEIRRGDLLGPMGESLIHTVGQRPNDREVKDAFIVSATTTFLGKFGEHSIVIVDKGSDDGVKPGNTFVVTRQHDGSRFQHMLDPRIVEERFPREDVGGCMAFEVKARATTCLVTQSIRELVRGDKCEMRPTSTRAALR